MRAEKSWIDKKIKLEKLTIQFNLIHNPAMRYFSRALNQRMKEETLAISRQGLVPIDPLLSEKLFNLETYTNGENIWVKEFIKNLVKKTLQQRHFGFNDDYSNFFSKVVTAKVGSNVSLTDLIFNTLRIKLKLPLEDAIEDSNLIDITIISDEALKLINSERITLEEEYKRQKENETNSKADIEKRIKELEEKLANHNDFLNGKIAKERAQENLLSKNLELNFCKQRLDDLEISFREKDSVLEKQKIQLEFSLSVRDDFLIAIAEQITATNLINNYRIHDAASHHQVHVHAQEEQASIVQELQSATKVDTGGWSDWLKNWDGWLIGSGGVVMAAGTLGYLRWWLTRRHRTQMGREVR